MPRDFSFSSDLPEGLTPGTTYALALSRDLTHTHSADWLAWEADPLDHPFPCVASAVSQWQQLYLLEVACGEPGLCLLTYDNSHTLHVLGFGSTVKRAEQVVKTVREALPPNEDPDRDKVPVAFWTYGSHGPQSLNRSLDVPTWADIKSNYTPGTLALLDKLFSPNFVPGHGGQFLLWHGEPGTGKTTALRALAREWREWCSFHYIADPDQFFGAHADYMLHVLLRDGEMSPARNADERWRVLILEDTGELLQADAKEKVGQALSRFLNCVDGMIGQGLRVLVLVTTNEPLGALHKAVTRPGRSALTIDFKTFTPLDARAWLEARGVDPAPRIHNQQTLADLYGELDGFEQRRNESAVGFA